MPTPAPLYVEKLTPLMMQPGIQQDGTLLAGRNWTDGQHCRFQRGLPRKMGGYKELQTLIPNVPRGTTLIPDGSNFDIYVAQNNATSPRSLLYFTVDPQGFIVNPVGPPNFIDRTPAAFIVDPNNAWQFDSMFSTTDNQSILLAFAAPNLASIDSTVEREVYFGDAIPTFFPSPFTAPLQPTGLSVSGGIVVLHPYLFLFGTAGHIQWTLANNPTVLAGDARVSAEKVVAGVATRGGNSSPAGLFWTLNNLIRCTFVGGEAQFAFDTISDETSILSPTSVIEYDGKFFWIATDRFCVYNGTVAEVPNSMNLNFFFDNLNYTYRQKVWATKVPRYGEIWWFFPFGDSTECNAAVIYNVRERVWYNTMLSRSCGIYNQIYEFPLWMGNTPNFPVPNYSLWEHEIGFDQVSEAGVSTAIDSFIETSVIALPGYGPAGDFTGIDRWSELYRFEPDLNQIGDMTFTIKGRNYARSPVQTVLTETFSPTTEKVDIRSQQREMVLRFESNVVGGFYEFGMNLMVFRIGDARQ